MPSGSCICSAINISYTGEPVFTAIRHRGDCRCMSSFQTLQVPKRNFTIDSGTPNVYTKVSDFDREINLHFCGICATALYRTGGEPNVKDLVGIPAGVLKDDPLLGETPKIEVCVDKRPKWMPKIESAMQLNSKYETVE